MEEFNALLLEVVKMDRTSGSKLSLLTTQSLQLLHQIPLLISTLKHAHSRAAPRSVGKVSSLYVLDAIVRAVAKEANKGSAPAGVFLRGVQDILEGVLKDFADPGWEEGKKKGLKILDIWRRETIFPPPTLSWLKSLFDGPVRAGAGGGGGNAVASGSAPPTQPRANSSTATAGMSPAQMEGLLRGFGSGNGYGGQSPSTQAPPPPPPPTNNWTPQPPTPALPTPPIQIPNLLLDPSALAAILASASASSVPPPAAQQSQSRDPRLALQARPPPPQQTPTQYQPQVQPLPASPGAGSMQDALARANAVAARLGGGAKPQGAGYQPSPPPPQQAGPSAPRFSQPTPTGPSIHPDRRPAPVGRVEVVVGAGKDEFGRDLPSRIVSGWGVKRPAEEDDGEEEMEMDIEEDSDEEEGGGLKVHKLPVKAQAGRGGAGPGGGAVKKLKIGLELSAEAQAMAARGSLPSGPKIAPMPTAISTPPAAPKATIKLDTFDYATRNWGDPTSWAALGEAYKNTTGMVASGEALMGLLMKAGVMPAMPGMEGMGGGGMNGGQGQGQGQGFQQQQQQQRQYQDNSHHQARANFDDGPYATFGNPRGGGGGRGGRGGGRGGGGGYGGGREGDYESDAVYLGGGE